MSFCFIVFDVHLISHPWTTLYAMGCSSPEPMRNGYCFHSHVIFPIWHRPYVLIFEVGSPLIGDKLGADCLLASRVRYHDQGGYHSILVNP